MKEKFKFVVLNLSFFIIISLYYYSFTSNLDFKSFTKFSAFYIIFNIIACLIINKENIFNNNKLRLFGYGLNFTLVSYALLELTTTKNLTCVNPKFIGFHIGIILFFSFFIYFLSQIKNKLIFRVVEGFIILNSLVNVISFNTRCNYFSWNELSSIPTALNVANKYTNYIFSITFILSIISYIIYHIYCNYYIKAILTSDVEFNWNCWEIKFTMILFIIAYFISIRGIYPSNKYNTNIGGFIPSQILFIARDNKISPSNNYNLDNLSKISKKYEKENIVEEDFPNVIVVMNESFSFLDDFEEFEISDDVAPFYKSLDKNCIKGYTYVSLNGGGTANSEYEFITNDSTFLYNGEIVYCNKFIKKDTPSIFTYFNDKGYSTTFFHPYKKDGWNRMESYSNLGAKNQVYLEDLLNENKNLLDGKTLLDDKANYQELLKIYNSIDGNKFIFNTTIQNHAPYDENPFSNDLYIKGFENYQESNYYVNLIRESDNALKYLVEELEKKDEKVILVFFGDHRPSLNDKILDNVNLSDNMMELTKTPYLIWANYDISNEINSLNLESNDLSLNYLSILMVKLAHLNTTKYQDYLWDLHKNYPIINLYGCFDKNGNFLPSSEYQNIEEISTYKDLIYNHIIDNSNRLEDFY